MLDAGSADILEVTEAFLLRLFSCLTLGLVSLSFPIREFDLDRDLFLPVKLILALWIPPIPIFELGKLISGDFVENGTSFVVLPTPSDTLDISRWNLGSSANELALTSPGVMDPSLVSLGW